MIKIARKFAQFKRDKHGNRPVLLIYNNLDAHCYVEVLTIFGEANIFVFFVVPTCTDAIQAIDAGIGRLIQIYFGQAWIRIMS